MYVQGSRKGGKGAFGALPIFEGHPEWVPGAAAFCMLLFIVGCGVIKLWKIKILLYHHPTTLSIHRSTDSIHSICSIIQYMGRLMCTVAIKAH
jgi:hypothetical protein